MAQGCSCRCVLFSPLRDPLTFLNQNHLFIISGITCQQTDKWDWFICTLKEKWPMKASITSARNSPVHSHDPLGLDTSDYTLQFQTNHCSHQFCKATIGQQKQHLGLLSLSQKQHMPHTVCSDDKSFKCTFNNYSMYNTKIVQQITWQLFVAREICICLSNKSRR